MLTIYHLKSQRFIQQSLSSALWVYCMNIWSGTSYPVKSCVFCLFSLATLLTIVCNQWVTQASTHTFTLQRVDCCAHMWQAGTGVIHSWVVTKSQWTGGWHCSLITKLQCTGGWHCSLITKVQCIGGWHCSLVAKLRCTGGWHCTLITKLQFTVRENIV